MRYANPTDARIRDGFKGGAANSNFHQLRDVACEYGSIPPRLCEQHRIESNREVFLWMCSTFACLICKPQMMMQSTLEVSIAYSPEDSQFHSLKLNPTSANISIQHYTSKR